MKQLPESDDSVVLRTDFSDESAWRRVCAAIVEPVGEFRAYVTFVSDRAFAGVEPVQLLDVAGEGAEYGFLFVVDHTTLTDPESPVLCVDLCDEPGRCFRVIPSQMWGVENNLSLANMDFEEFAEATDADGVFRGIPEG